MPSEPGSSGDEIEIIERKVAVAQGDHGLSLVKKRKGENGPDGKEWERGRESRGKRPRHTFSGISSEFNTRGLGHNVVQTRPTASPTTQNPTSPSISKEDSVIGTNGKKSIVKHSKHIVDVSDNNTKPSSSAIGTPSFVTKKSSPLQQNRALTQERRLVARKSTRFISDHARLFGRRFTPTGSPSESDSSNPQLDTDKDTRPTQSTANTLRRRTTALKSTRFIHYTNPSAKRSIPSTASTSEGGSSNDQRIDVAKEPKDSQKTTSHVAGRTPQTRTSLPNLNDKGLEQEVSIAKSKRHSGPPNPSEVIVIESSGDEGGMTSLQNKIPMSSKHSRSAALYTSNENAMAGPSNVTRTEKEKERKTILGPNLDLIEAINQTYSHPSRQKPERKSSGTKALVNNIIDLTLDDSDETPNSISTLGLPDQPRPSDHAATRTKLNPPTILSRETVQLPAEPTRSWITSQRRSRSPQAAASPLFPELPSERQAESESHYGVMVGSPKAIGREDTSCRLHIREARTSPGSPLGTQPSLSNTRNIEVQEKSKKPVKIPRLPSSALPQPRSPSKDITQPRKSKSPAQMVEGLSSENRFKLPPPLSPKTSEPSSNVSPATRSPERELDQQTAEDMQAILDELDLPEPRVAIREEQEQEGDADDEAEVNNQILSRSSSGESSPEPVLPTLRRSLRHSSGSSYSDAGHPTIFTNEEVVETPPDSSPSPGPEEREIAPTYGGFAALTWAQHKKDMRNFNLKYYLAKDLPTALPDSVNRLSDYTRLDRGMADVFRAFILESIVEDEAGALDIDVINAVDNEPTPLFEFKYTNRIWYGEGVPLPDYSQLHGCDCVGKCDPRSKTCLCAIKQREYLEMEDGFVYDKNGRLKHPGYPIFECNEMCGCDDDCRNRVVQHGRKCQVAIKKTLDKGWGVFNGSKRLPSGTFIGVYAGELLTDEQSEIRGRLYNKIGRTYLFDIDFYHLKGKDQEIWTSKYTVDAYHAGNFTRFLNHSCDPNARLFACYINEPDIEKPFLVAFSIRDIEPHEEICFNYSGRYPGEESDDEEEKAAIDRNDPIYSDCRCGARNCKGVMFN